MTGYGEAAGENDRFRVSVTLRAVNHRYLDLVLRGLESRRELESRVREELSGRLARGRVEAIFEVTSVASRSARIDVDEGLVQSLRRLCDSLADRGWISAELEFRDLLRLPEVVAFQMQEPDWRPQDQDLLMRLTAEAADRLLAARSTEGRQLSRALEERCDQLAALVGELRVQRDGRVEEMARQLEQRIVEVLDGRLPDEVRLAQEVAFLVDRSDVVEELDRLGSHLEHMRSVMAGEGSLGKRLDFLAQEVFRELNTIAAKCRDSAMAQRVVDGKVICEQIREQVQNVE